MMVNDPQKQFARGPVGSWESVCGGGVDMLFNVKMAFWDDGNGRMEDYGEGSLAVLNFQWKSVADQVIEITHRGGTRAVRFDFSISKIYGHESVQIFEVGRSPDKDGEVGFWLSPFSLVYMGPAPGRLTRFWEKLTDRFGNRDG